MNEIFVLLESASDGGRIVLFALFAVAVGFLVFDRRARKPRAEDARRPRDRVAA